MPKSTYKSPFKNCFPPQQGVKDDQTFRGIKKPHIPVDSPGIVASCKYIAYSSGNDFAYHKLDQPGRGVFSTGGGYSEPSGQGKVLDLHFSPFDDSQLATAFGGGQVVINTLADYDEKEESCKEMAVLDGHTKNCLHVKYHPTAMGVIASASQDNTVKLWNIEEQAEVKSIDLDGGKPFSMEWSTDGGAMLGVTTKDKNGGLSIYDPRKEGVIAKMVFPSSKKSCCFFASNVNMVGVTCFNKKAERKFMIWDTRNMSGDPIYNQVLDQQSSVLFPFYDSDSSTLFCVGRGEGTVRQFHLLDPQVEINGKKPSQIVWPKNPFSTNDPQRGGCLVPKRAMDVLKHEVARVIKLTDKKIVPVSFTVMRKNPNFQDDLFPEAFIGLPSCQAKEYFENEDQDLTPVVGSLNPKKRKNVAVAKMAVKKSYAELETENAELKKKIEELEAQLAA